MAQLVVRNIETSVKTRLQRRARKHGRSMEEEVRDILRAAVVTEDEGAEYGLGSEIASLFKDIGFTEEEAAQLELHGWMIEPASFE